MSNRKGLQNDTSGSVRFLLKSVGKISPYSTSVTRKVKHEYQKPSRQQDNFEGEITTLGSIYGSSKHLFENNCKSFTGSLDHESQPEFNLVQDPRKSEFSYRKYIFMQKMLLVLTIFSFFIDLVSVEMYVLENTDNSASVNISRHVDMLNSLTTLTIIMTMFMRYVCLNQLQIDQKKFYCIRKSEGFFAQICRFLGQKESLKHFLIQLCIILPHSFFPLHHKYIYLFQSYDEIMLKHKINDILKMLSLFRSYIVVRAMITLTIYSTPRASRLCSHNRINHSILYSVKCLLREEPLRIIALVFLVQQTTLSLGLKIAEGSLIYMNPGIPETDFESYQNCFWCVFIAMSTVGYGDYYPKTLPGRIFIIMAAVSGILLSSLLIVSLSAYLTMQANQSKSHLTLIRLQHQSLLKRQATQALIQTMNMTKYLSSQDKSSDYKIKDLFTTIKYKIDQVKFRTRKIKSLVNNNNIMEQMNRLFELFQDSLQESFKNQLLLQEEINNLNRDTKVKTRVHTIFFEQTIQGISKSVHKN